MNVSVKPFVLWTPYLVKSYSFLRPKHHVSCRWYAYYYARFYMWAIFKLFLHYIMSLIIPGNQYLLSILKTWVKSSFSMLFPVLIAKFSPCQYSLVTAYYYSHVAWCAYFWYEPFSWWWRMLHKGWIISSLILLEVKTTISEDRSLCFPHAMTF